MRPAGAFTIASNASHTLLGLLPEGSLQLWDKNKWDPISIHTWGEENTPGSVTINGNVNSYEKAADKTHAALVIESGKVEIDGSVGEDASLYDLSVYSEGSIEVTGNVKADYDVILWTRGKDEKRAEAQSSSYFYKLPARDPVIGRDITVGGTITADNTVKLVAGNDVTIKGKVTGNAKNIEETLCGFHQHGHHS